MGASSLAGMLEYGGTVDQVLEWHLRSNHYPPLPLGVIPLAKKAIRYANKGQWNKVIKLGDTCTYKGASVAPVSACVRAWHLDQFITRED